MRGRIERELDALLDEPRRAELPRESVLALAQAGASAGLLTRLAGLPPSGEDRTTLAISLAWYAAHGADRALAHALADRAMAGIADGPDSERHLLALARVYAKLGDIAAETGAAQRIAKLASRIDALTASMGTAELDLVPKLSFETF